MESLAVKYRPKTFDDVLGQEYTKEILESQVKTGRTRNAYLFCGPSGDGKTTMARIFANMVNEGQGSPIEIDGASNNGVDNVRELIDEARSRSLDSKYKFVIVDECHQLTQQAWSAFLKCLEEPPEYTKFVFCTTDPQKIPSTILNRLMRFDFKKVPAKDIAERLKRICSNEGLSDYDDACDYIAKLSNGGVRDAISMLEKCSEYDRRISMDVVCNVLGTNMFGPMFELTNAILDGNKNAVLGVMNGFKKLGVESIKDFMTEYVSFLLDLTKYCVFHDLSDTSLPESLLLPKSKGDTLCIQYTIGVENAPSVFAKLTQLVNQVRADTRNDDSPCDTATIGLMSLCEVSL